MIHTDGLRLPLADCCVDLVLNRHEDLFHTYRDGFREAGLRLIDAREHDQRVAYRSLGDIVYMLTISPWEVPDFDLERDIDALLALESFYRQDEGVVLTHGNFVIEAEKP